MTSTHRSRRPRTAQHTTADEARPASRLGPPPPARHSPRSTAPPPTAPRSASGIARAAGVDRSFLYRHRDLLEQIHALEADPARRQRHPAPAVTRASLQADLLAARERALRLNSRIRQLEKRLSEARVLRLHRFQVSFDVTPLDLDPFHRLQPDVLGSRTPPHGDENDIDLDRFTAERNDDARRSVTGWLDRLAEVEFGAAYASSLFPEA